MIIYKLNVRLNEIIQTLYSLAKIQNGAQNPFKYWFFHDTGQKTQIRQ